MEKTLGRKVTFPYNTNCFMCQHSTKNEASLNGNSWCAKRKCQFLHITQDTLLKAYDQGLNVLTK